MREEDLLVRELIICAVQVQLNHEQADEAVLPRPA
jgi:hypothetical protein